MIYSRGNTAIERLTDGKVAALWFGADGATFGMGSTGWASVGPVPRDVKEGVPLAESAAGHGSFTISRDSARELSKAVPRLPQFGGLLDHFDASVDRRGEVTVRTTDGKRDHVLGLRALATSGNGLPESTMGEALSTEDDGYRVVVPRRALKAMLEAMDRACPDPGGAGAAWLSVAADGSGIVLRGVNVKTDQRFLGAIPVHRNAEWIEDSEWELRLRDRTRGAPAASPAARKKPPPLAARGGGAT